MAKGQAEHLMGMLAAMLADAGLTWADLDGLGVGTGPGNFTGIRIAVSAARGLALGLGRPAIGVNGFDVLAYGLPRPVTAMIPAPRGQAYVQRFTDRVADAPLLVDQPPADHAMIPPPDEAAKRIALIAASRLGTPQPRPAPLYVRAPDAAPSRTPAPVILS